MAKGRNDILIYVLLPWNGKIFKLDFLDLHTVLFGTYILIRIETQRLKNGFEETH